MSNEVQKKDFILPGGLGTASIGGQIRPITEIKKGNKTRTVTLTFGIVAKLFLDRHPTEDADFEVLQPKQIENHESNQR